MKLYLLDRARSPDGSFTIIRNRYPNFIKVWHHHPELKMVLIRKSKGTRFIHQKPVRPGRSRRQVHWSRFRYLWSNRGLLAFASFEKKLRSIEILHVYQGMKTKSCFRVRVLSILLKKRRMRTWIKYTFLSSKILKNLSIRRTLGKWPIWTPRPLAVSLAGLIARPVPDTWTKYG